MDHLWIEMFEVKEDMIPLRPRSSALADFDGHRPRHDIARSKILGVRRIALHEPLALRVGEIPPLPARAFGDQDADAVNAGGMKLHELHVLERQPRP